MKLTLKTWVCSRRVVAHKLVLRLNFSSSELHHFSRICGLFCRLEHFYPRLPHWCWLFTALLCLITALAVSQDSCTGWPGQWLLPAVYIFLLCLSLFFCLVFLSLSLSPCCLFLCSPSLTPTEPFTLITASLHFLSLSLLLCLLLANCHSVLFLFPVLLPPSTSCVQ